MPMRTEELREQVRSVIAYSQTGIENPNVDPLLEKWEHSKRWMYHSFMGKKLIKECGTVRLALDDETKKEIYNDFICWVDHENYDLSKFLIEAVSVEDFFNNSMSKSYEYAPGKVIAAGAKVIKSFKCFVFDKDLLRVIQDRASELIQQSYIEGELCISIHPLDFLSSSENTLRWRSCHSLDGEYRAGNLSYIGDETTVIAYIHTGKETELPHFPPEVPWNNKMWRCLFFLSKQEYSSTLNIIFAGRPYPMCLPQALNEVRRRIVGDELWSDWTNEVIHEVPFGNEVFNLRTGYFAIAGMLFEPRDLIEDAKNSMHFNDLLNSSCYEPYYSWRQASYWGISSKSKIIIGSEATCLRCGKDIINTDDTMMCKECECTYGVSGSEDYLECELCGERIHIEDRYWIDDHEVCCRCADAMPVCKICGEPHAPYNMNADSVCIFCQ